jgi:uncharacterized protein
MSASENKLLMQQIYSELAKGNGKPFVAAMAGDFCWTIPGNTKWSKSYRGKQTVIDDLLTPLFARFADQYTANATRFIAEGDCVVVEVRGQVTTKSGAPYCNRYCNVFRLADGKLRELTEYMDTALVDQVLV